LPDPDENLMRLRPLPFALAILALDAVWAVQAFGVSPTRAGSNVALVSLMVWTVLHLPAAILGGLVLKPFGVLDHGAAELPAWAILLTAGLGLLQAFGMAYGFMVWWNKRHALPVRS
jgi:hypothetical protein